MEVNTVIKLYESLKEKLGQETAELLIMFIEEKIKDEIYKMRRVSAAA